MRQLRRPIRLCSRQMSRWMATMKSSRTPPACSHIAKERFAGWWIFGSTLQQLPKSVWVERKKKTTKTTSRVYHMVPHCCSTCLFLDAQTRKKQKKRTTRTRIVQSISARTAVKIWTTEYLGIAREKSNPTLWNHIFKLRDTAVEVLRAHENCCRSFTLL